MSLIPLFPQTGEDAAGSRAMWESLTPEQRLAVRELLWRWRTDPARFAWDVFRLSLWWRQVEICHAVATHKRVAVKSGHKIGKALSLETLVPTPSGWTTQGELRVGDRVLDEHGKPCTVVGLSPVWHDRPCYEVTFSDGAVHTADAEHEWRILPVGDAPTSETTATLVDRLAQRIPCPVDHRSVVRVARCPTVPVRCIEVGSPTHLYLAGPTAIPTHNSVTAAVLALWWALTRKNGRVILTAPSANQIRNILWMELTKLVNAANRRPEIKALGGLGGHLYEAPDRGFHLGPGHEVAGRATNEPERMAGTSGDELLYLVDEASGIDQRIFEAIEGNLTGGGRVVLFSNPTQVSGEFFDAFHSKAGLYHCITVSSEETPNARTGRTIIPGLATREAILDNRKAWGPDWRNDVRYQVRVLGLFPAKSAYAVINLDDTARAKDRFFDLIGTHFEVPEICSYLPADPDAPKGTPRTPNPHKVKARLAYIADDTAMARALAWYESSRMEDETLRVADAGRWHLRWKRYLLEWGLVADDDMDLDGRGLPAIPRFYYQRFPLRLGVDVARYGTDTTVVTPSRGPRVFRPRTLQLGGAKEVARFVAEIALGREGHLTGLAAPGERPTVLIDEIGEGSGATDILIAEYGDKLHVVPVRTSKAASDPENYNNLRTELHFAGREWLRDERNAGPADFDNHGITGGMFPPCQILEDDLVAPQYSFTPQGQFKVESKDEIKTRIGRSPDHGDSFLLSVYGQPIAQRVPTPPTVRDFADDAPRWNRDQRGW